MIEEYYIISEYSFDLICEIVPLTDANGEPALDSPHKRYKNNLRSLHKFGSGPFCEFRIRKDTYNKTGVYLIVIDGRLKYIGKCEDLRKRFNSGYGQISPRACFQGGQSTNCRINSLLLDGFRQKKKVFLYFLETSNSEEIERIIIRDRKPPWNKTLTGNKNRYSKKHKRPNAEKLKSPENKGYKGKYLPLKKYLKNQCEKKITLSYDEVETILNKRLPKSAYQHRAWWANGGHNHSLVWLEVGYKVKDIVLHKKTVIFEAFT